MLLGVNNDHRLNYIIHCVIVNTVKLVMIA